MSEKETNGVLENVEELSDSELDDAVGGVNVSIVGNITISWFIGEKMNDIWSVVDGYKSLLNAWNVNANTLKAVIKERAKEKYKSSTARYHATVGGKVVAGPDGIS